MLGKLSRYSRLTACVFRYSNEPAGGHVGHVGVLGLKRPADERGEAAGFVLQLPQPLQVLDPLGQRFDVAEHHRRRAAAAQLVPHAVHVEPIVGQHLAARDCFAHAIDQNLAAAAGQAAEAGRLQSLQHRAQRQLGDLGEVMNLRRAEAVDVDLRKVLFDVAQQLFVPLQLELGMQAALHQNLVAAQVDASRGFFAAARRDRARSLRRALGGR